MGKQRRDVEKEQFWRLVLAEQAASGLSIRKFCQQERLREPAFYAWRRAIRERDGEEQPASSEPPFIPAIVTSEPSCGASIAIELASGCVLRLPESTSATWLADLVHALETRAAR